MASDFGFVFHPWHSAAWRQALFERAAGEIGLSHVTVPLVTGEITQFRFADDEGPRLFTTEGGWHYAVDPARYGGGLRPRTARWVGKRQVLEQVLGAAARNGLAVGFQVELSGMRAIIEQQPELGRQTAWNEPLPAHPPCLNQPAVRHLLRSTIDELRSYSPALFALAWADNAGAVFPEQELSGVKSALVELLRLCFCAGCREIAAERGVDAVQAARSVKVHMARIINQRLSSGGASSADDDVLRAHHMACADATARWLHELGASLPDGSAHLIDGRSSPLVDVPAAHPWRVLFDLSQPIDDRTVTEAALALTATLPPEQRAVRIPSFGRCESASELVRVVHDLSQGGMRLVEFSGLDIDPPEIATWLKQAVRYARRG